MTLLFDKVMICKWTVFWFRVIEKLRITSPQQMWSYSWLRRVLEQGDRMCYGSVGVLRLFLDNHETSLSTVCGINFRYLWSRAHNGPLAKHKSQTGPLTRGLLLFDGSISIFIINMMYNCWHKDHEGKLVKKPDDLGKSRNLSIMSPAVISGNHFHWWILINVYCIRSRGWAFREEGSQKL